MRSSAFLDVGFLFVALDRYEGVSDRELTGRYCAGSGLGRGRVAPSRAVLRSFLMQHYGSDRRYGYQPDLKFWHSRCVVQANLLKIKTHDSDHPSSNPGMPIVILALL